MLMLAQSQVRVVTDNSKSEIWFFYLNFSGLSYKNLEPSIINPLLPFW